MLKFWPTKNVLAIALGTSALVASFALALAATVQTSVEVPANANLVEAEILIGPGLFVSWDEEGNDQVTGMEFEFVELLPPLETDHRVRHSVYLRNDSDVDLRVIGPCDDFYDEDSGLRIGFIEMFRADGQEGGACPWHTEWFISPSEVVRAEIEAQTEEGGETEVGPGSYPFTVVFGAIGHQDDPEPEPIVVPAPQSPADTVIVRLTGLGGSGMPSDSSRPFPDESVSEKFFAIDHDGNNVNQVVTGWDLATDLSSLTFTLKPNVPFHGGFGNLSADDVVWSYNTGNPGLNPASTTSGGGAWISFLGDQPVVEIDELTVEFPIQNFDVTWQTKLFGQSGLGLGISSKEAYDLHGESWVRSNVIGTGPFEVVNFTPGDSLEVAAVASHHRVTPGVGAMTYLIMPDISVAEAALETGAIDILAGEIDLASVDNYRDGGFDVTGAGAGSIHSISFSGNYWESNHYYTGEPLENNFIPGTYAASPWMGNPDDLASMERSKKVRLALSHAIDRDQIVETATGGAGWPIYIYGASPTNPNWDDKWSIDYDPALAEQLLDEAGYPRDGDGNRFGLPFFIRTGRGDEEIAQSVADQWRAIGIDVQDWMAAYHTYRPSLINRTATEPWIHTAGASGPHAPWDWPVMGHNECSTSRGGFNIGIEAREFCEFFDEMTTTPDESDRLTLRAGLNDFLHEWNPVIGLLAIPRVAIANSIKIDSWDMPVAISEQSIHHPEFIVLN